MKKILQSVGPGFIIASVVLGPGSITVASRIGSEHGYTLLWVIILAAVSMMIYTSMSVRFGVTHEETILQAISNKYGRWFSVVIGLSAFIAASSFQFGNNLGVGIGMQGITGIDERVWPLLFTPLGMLLLFRAKNLYRLLEKLMMVLVMIMIFAFLFNLILAAPDAGQVAKGFVPGMLKTGNLDVVAAMVGTTFVLHVAIYQSYLAHDKGWKVVRL